ncbi:MAG: asparagine synthase B [Caldilinea sp. CFX5]|nr:asparagine synthase B [Caldilinea sp. CFX5]
MCGIAGSYPQLAPAAVEALVAQLHHRGPDGHGLVNLAAGSLGHTRLAILDIGGGHQPMHHEQVSISFNGEIYNHRALRQQYLADEPLQTCTDTEVILRLYAKLGTDCVALLDGMFAFAILGGDDLFLARDPLGIKPLYTGLGSDGTRYFASEIKALAQVTDAIEAFPPGHWYHSKLGWQRYYTIQTEAAQHNAATNAATDTSERYPCEAAALPVIRATLRDAVQKRLMADVPLGVSLSGGLDSSIVALLAREEMAQLHTFAVGVEGSSDLAAARTVARFLGTTHHEYCYTEEEMQAALPEVLFYLESFDPALVRSAIPNYFLARLAADHVKVFLTGEGADELYAGYDYLGRRTDPAALHEELLHITGALHNTNLQRADRMSMAHGLEARVPFLDVQSVGLALGLPAAWKTHSKTRHAKALLRQAFAADLPPAIVNRPKEKFSQGAGSSHLLAQQAATTISDAEFVAEQQRLATEWNYRLPGKEALYYYKLLRQCYRDEWILPSMGHSRSL